MKKPNPKSHLNVGLDLEETTIFREHTCQKKPGFYEKIFSPKEIQYCLSKADPPQHFAARFSGKEAAIKAASVIAPLFYNEIEILNKKNGAPFMTIAADRPEFKNKVFLISLTHEKSYSAAFVVMLDQELLPEAKLIMNQVQKESHQLQPLSFPSRTSKFSDMLNL